MDIIPGQVILGWGLYENGWNLVPDQTINPAQDTVVWGGWVWGPADYVNLADAEAQLAETSIFISIDGGTEVLAHQGPITNICAGAGPLTYANGKNHVTGMFHRSFGPKVK